MISACCAIPFSLSTLPRSFAEYSAKLSCLPFHKKILCEKCGKDKCLDHDSLHFDGIYTLMRYEDICVKAIHQLKDDRQLNFAEYSAKLLGNVLRENGIAQQAEYHQLSANAQIKTP